MAAFLRAAVCCALFLGSVPVLAQERVTLSADQILLNKLPGGAGVDNLLQSIRTEFSRLDADGNGVIDGVELGTIAFTDRRGGPVRFVLENVVTAKLLLTDRLIAATRPLDTSGVEVEVLGGVDEEPAETDTPDIPTEYLSSEQDQ